MKEKRLYNGNFNNVLVIQDMYNGNITILTIKDIPLNVIDVEEYIKRSGFDLDKVTYSLYSEAYIDIVEHSYIFNK